MWNLAGRPGHALGNFPAQSDDLDFCGGCFGLEGVLFGYGRSGPGHERFVICFQDAAARAGSVDLRQVDAGIAGFRPD